MAAEDANPTTAAVSSAGSAVSPAMRRRLQQCFDRGTQNMQTGNFDYATEMFTQCVVGDPASLIYTQKFLENLYRKYNNNKKGGTLAGIRSAGGKASMKKASMTKDWRGVVKTGLEVLKLNPWDVPALLHMAKACAELGNTECQLAYLKGALNADMKNGEVNRECAIALTAIGDYDQAIACWTRVATAPKADVDEANREIANLQVEKTMQKTGARMDKEAAENRATGQQTAASTSTASTPVKRTRAQELEEQIKTNPAEIVNYAELAEHYAKEEKWSEAENVLRKALEATGGDLRIREQLEDVQLRKARQQSLIADKRAAELNTAEATEQAQRMRAELNRLELDVFRSRVERYPTNTHWKYELGLRLKRAGNFNEAIKMFQEARTDPKHKGVVLLDLGECFQQIKQYNLAMQQYVRAIEEIPEKETEQRKKAFYRAGVLAMGKGELDEAEKHLSQLAEMDFGYRDVSDRLDKIVTARNKG